MGVAIPNITIADILPPIALVRLNNFRKAYSTNTLALEEGKSTAQLLRERVLEPHREALQDKWDLNYLSYVLCFALKIIV